MITVARHFRSLAQGTSSPNNRRLLGGAAARRASTAAAGWSDDIVRRATLGSTTRDALAAALSRDASSASSALGAGSGGLAGLGGGVTTAAAAAAAATAATVDPCRSAKAVAAVACAAAAADGTRSFWTEETRAPGAVAMCGHAISTLSTLACADVAGAESCAAAATAALPCSAPCTASLGEMRSACDALVPRSQHGRFIEESAAGDVCRDAVMAAHDTCSTPSSGAAAVDGSCAALLEAMPESLSRGARNGCGEARAPGHPCVHAALGRVVPRL